MTRRHEVDDRDWLELAQATKVKDLLAAKPQRATRGLSPVLVDRNTTIEDTLLVTPPPRPSTRVYGCV
jgi:hypothetical protein